MLHSVDFKAARAQPSAVVVAGRARFTILSPTLVRIEWAEDGRFEDRPTLFALRRKHRPPKFTTTERRGRLIIETDALTLSYRPSSAPLSPRNLEIHVHSVDTTWQPGLAGEQNLGGPYRSLDGCDRPWPRFPGLASRDGWYVVDDSASPVLVGGKQPWIAERPAGKRVDWYFFGAGHDYYRALSDLFLVSGPVPMPPRCMFGSWYSRYWPYRDADYGQIVEDYVTHGLPLDVMVLDMDWHRAGWTGYSWNHELLPHPRELLEWMADRGLSVTLNLHPADGVHAHEDAYDAFARAMRAPKRGKPPVPFNCSDRQFMEHYFKLLHRPLEDDGVDFWWVDWQQGQQCDMTGLDPLPWLNLLHHEDSARRARPGLLSRWGGWGDHRHPMHFSGDTQILWNVLRYQVGFTTASSNAGCFFWSHDVGGHYNGLGRAPELFVRWMQFGALSAAFRIHSSNRAELDRRPWLFGPEVLDIAREALLARGMRMPYLYSAAWQACRTARPFIRGLYYDHPEEDEAYRWPEEYQLGDDLIVRPAVDPGWGEGKLAPATAWLPPGEWYGRNGLVSGPRVVVDYVALDETAVWMRGGAPIARREIEPGRPRPLAEREKNPPLEFDLCPGPDSARVFYEDDPDSKDDSCRETPIRCSFSEAGARIVIGPSTPPGPARDIHINLHYIEQPERVRVGGRTLEMWRQGCRSHWWAWQRGAAGAHLVLSRRRLDRAIEVVVEYTPDRERLVELSRRAEIFSRLSHVLALGEHPAFAPLEALTTALVREAEDVARAEREIAKWLRQHALATERDVTLQRAARLLTASHLQVYDAVAREWNAEGVGIDLAFGDVPQRGPRANVEVAVDEASSSLALRGKLRKRVETRQPLRWQERFTPARGPGRIVGEVRVETTWHGTKWRMVEPFDYDRRALLDWLVLGPFPAGDSIEAPHPPERGFDAKRTYKGMDGAKLKWHPLSEHGERLECEPCAPDTGVVDLWRALHKPRAVAYAATFIKSTKKQAVPLRVSSSAGLILWLNGKRVYLCDAVRSLDDSDTIELPLKRGWNTLLLKSAQTDESAWRFRLVLDAPPDAPASLCTSTQPPPAPRKRSA